MCQKCSLTFDIWSVACGVTKSKAGEVCHDTSFFGWADLGLVKQAVDESRAQSASSIR